MLIRSELIQIRFIFFHDSTALRADTQIRVDIKIFKWNLKHHWFEMAPIVIKWLVEEGHPICNERQPSRQTFTDGIAWVLTVLDYLGVDKESL